LYSPANGPILRGMDDTPFLDGQLLIAMPGMGDPRFEKAVIFLCAHSAEGAMGLIVNKPASDLKLRDLLGQLKIEPKTDAAEGRVHFGGPVEHGRGFVLHSAEYGVEGSTLQVSGEFAMTATVDILQDMAKGSGPAKALLALGYSGWGPGQLEGEIQANGWLTAAAAPGIVFDERDGGKWEAALKSLNIDPLLLSAGGGRA
jgi:putative transcriptional regulator